MIVATIVRTRNEEYNIETFCRAYIDTRLADVVLVADGGSDDDTVAIAESVPGVKVRDFSGQIFNEDEEEDYDRSLWRNPHGLHINFMIDWAEEVGADWIIFDDCDCLPNLYLKGVGREIIEDTRKDFIYAVRIYHWGMDQWFPKLSINFKEGPEAWMPSLWAWRANQGFRASEDDPWRHEFIKRPTAEEKRDLLPPLALLHYSWLTEEETEAKIDFYKSIGQHPTMLHPTAPAFGGEPEALREWMIE